MFRILTAVSVFITVYVMPVFADPPKTTHLIKSPWIIVKAILPFAILATIIWFLKHNILAGIYTKKYFKEKEKHETKKEIKPKTPNTTEKPKYEPIDFRAKK